jgi:hypothetical protein
MFSVLAMALAGIHPVLSAAFMDLTAIITGCDLSSSLTPFSALSLTAGRYSENSVSNQHW